MSDALIFAIGSGVTFVFLAGLYVVLRADFQHRHDLGAPERDAA